MTETTTTTETANTTRAFSTSQLQGKPPFRGEVVNAEWRNEDGKETLILSVRNIDRPDLQYPKTMYIKYSEKRNSIWGNFLRSLEATGTTIGTYTDLIGKSFVFTETFLTFGKDSAGKQIEKALYLPTQRL